MVWSYRWGFDRLSPQGTARSGALSLSKHLLRPYFRYSYSSTAGLASGKALGRLHCRLTARIPPHIRSPPSQSHQQLSPRRMVGATAPLFADRAQAVQQMPAIVVLKDGLAQFAQQDSLRQSLGVSTRAPSGLPRGFGWSQSPRSPRLGPRLGPVDDSSGVWMCSQGPGRDIEPAVFEELPSRVV